MAQRWRGPAPCASSAGSPISLRPARTSTFPIGSRARCRRRPCIDPARRYGEVTEFVHDLHAPEPRLLGRERLPLVERDPRAFLAGALGAPRLRRFLPRRPVGAMTEALRSQAGHHATCHPPERRAPCHRHHDPRRRHRNRPLRQEAPELTWEGIAAGSACRRSGPTSAAMGMSACPEGKAESLGRRARPAAGSCDASCRKAPRKDWNQTVPTDPCIYRFYEIVGVYGPSIKAMIHEKFGDGIMSAIDFDMTRDARRRSQGRPGEGRDVRQISRLQGLVRELLRSGPQPLLTRTSLCRGTPLWLASHLPLKGGDQLVRTASRSTGD